MTPGSRERLGASDLAIVEFRRIMALSSFEGIVPKSADWRTLGVAPEELALRATADAAD